MSAPQDLGLRAQAAAVADGELTPRELFAATRARVARHDGRVNAVIALHDEQIEPELRAVSVGPLYGVPVAVKDMFSLPWHAPRDGAAVASPSPGPGLSGVARRLRGGGALALLVANMHQLGIGTTGHISAGGPGRNPWDRERCAGGSSGGSAAAVAMRMVAGAVGSDAGGSIRIPAAYCGIVGLKPSWRSVPTDGYTGAYSTMGAIGPLARDAGDCRALAEVLLGRRLAAPRRSALRIALPLHSHWTDVDPAIGDACRGAVDLLAADGAQVTDVIVRDAEHIALATIVATGAERLPQLDSQWLKTVFPSLHPSVRGVVRSRLSFGANLVQRVARLRTSLRRATSDLFADADLLALPTTPAPPPAVDRPQVRLASGPASADVTALHHAGLANLTGIPAISIPCGVDGAGMPIGLTLHARWGGEALLLAVAERFERLTERAFVERSPLGASPRSKGAS